MKTLALVLATLLAFPASLAFAEPAGAQDAGAPLAVLPVPAGEAVDPLLSPDGGVPGLSVQLNQGSAAPFTGNLFDKTRWAHVAALRESAQLEAESYKLSLQEAQHRQQMAEQDRDSRPSWGALFAAGGGALVVGIVLTLVVVYTAKK